MAIGRVRRRLAAVLAGEVLGASISKSTKTAALG
jgi:hypothetical protein